MKNQLNRSARFAIALLGTLMFASSAFAAHHEESKNTIVDVAVGAGSFTTLVTALKAAGLVETLSGAGPFTVFAPTDEAFAALPKGALEELLANPEQLANVLTLHVVPGIASAADVMKLASVDSVQGTSGW